MRSPECTYQNEVAVDDPAVLIHLFTRGPIADDGIYLLYASRHNEERSKRVYIGPFVVGESIVVVRTHRPVFFPFADRGVRGDKMAYSWNLVDTLAARRIRSHLEE